MLTLKYLLRSKNMCVAIMRICIFPIPLLLSLNFASAQDYTQPQNRIKSIYIYNFLKDVQWPNSQTTGEVKVCLLEQSPLFEELEKLAASKKVNDKKIILNQISAPNKCQACDLVYIEDGAAPGLKRSESCNTLFITSGFYDKNVSNIVLMFYENKLQFSINNALCEKFGFKVSAHLLSLANPKILPQ